MTPRPKVLKGTTTFCKTGCGDLQLTINKRDDGNVFEVTARLGKNGGCAFCQTEAMSRLLNHLIERGADLTMVAGLLRDIGCQHSNKAMSIRSCPDAISHLLLEEVS